MRPSPRPSRWRSLSIRALPTSASPGRASDVIRLAVARLQEAQAGGLDLARELAAQAWAEVQVYRGRAKRGLPPRPERGG